MTIKTAIIASLAGQGLIVDGKRSEAKMQLAEIKARGDTETWAYAALSKALRGERSNY